MLTLNTNTELRAKGVGAILNFPGVGSNPGLVLNGGVLNAGDDTVFSITGKIKVASPSYISPADVGGGAVVQARGFNIAGQLSGSGTLIIFQAGTTVAQELSGNQNTFSGDIILKAGWLKGSGLNSLGSGNITIDPMYALDVDPSISQAEGPAQLELGYDINSSGKLTLANGGMMVLHQNATFSGVTIEGSVLANGTYPYAKLLTDYPANFAPDGSGSITVKAPAAPTFGTTKVGANGVTIVWTGGGRLQESSSVLGPWADVAGNPQGSLTVQAAGPRKFYRLISP
jgi:hypothetical protein